MERHTEQEPFINMGWPGGWRPDLNPGQADADSVRDILNMVFEENHALAKRKGFIKITNDVAGMDTPEFVHVNRVYTTSGAFPNFTQQVLYFNEDDGAIFYQSFGELLDQYENSTGTDLVASGSSPGPASVTSNIFRVWPVTALTWESKIYITSLRYGGFDSSTNQGDTSATGLWATEDASQDSPSLPIVYDVQAGSWSTLASHPLDSTTSGFPRARTGIVKYDRIFLANVHSQSEGYRYPSRLIWSGDDTAATLAPETWMVNNYIDVGGDDGSEICSLQHFGDQILIFKNNSVWSLVGTDSTTFALYQLDDTIGCEPTFGADAYAGVAYFLDYRTGVWAYDGSQFSLLSEPINDILLSDINRSAIYRAVVKVWDNKIFVSVPTGTGAFEHNDTTYMYDLRRQTWTKWDYGWVPTGPTEYFTDYTVSGVGVTGDAKMYTGGNKDETGIWVNETGDNDDGVAIDAYFETQWINPGNAGDKHRLRRIEFLVDTDSDDVEVTLTRDFQNTTWQTGTIAQSGSADVEWHSQEDKYDDGFWTWLKIRLENDTLDEWFQIDRMGFVASTRPILRGRIFDTGYTA